MSLMGEESTGVSLKVKEDMLGIVGLSLRMETTLKLEGIVYFSNISEVKLSRNVGSLYYHVLYRSPQ